VRLMETFQTNLSGGCSGDDATCGVGDGNDGVIKGRCDVGLALCNVLLGATSLTRGRTACLCHRMLSYKKLGLSATEQDGKYLLLASSNSLLRALTGTCVVFGALTA